MSPRTGELQHDDDIETAVLVQISPSPLYSCNMRVNPHLIRSVRTYRQTVPVGNDDKSGTTH
jgi:hypothetical protein